MLTPPRAWAWMKTLISMSSGGIRIWSPNHTLKSGVQDLEPVYYQSTLWGPIFFLSHLQLVTPWLGSQLHFRLGWAPPLPCLLHNQVALLAHVWELFLIGNQCDNTRSELQMFKLASLSLCPSYWMELLHMPKELTGVSDWVLPRWCPTGKRIYTGAGRKIEQ